MATSDLVILHLHGRFRADGTAIGPSNKITVGAVALPVVTQTLHGPDREPTHSTPLDDDRATWLRLKAEYDVWCDPATRDAGHGRPEGLTHRDWTAHPHHAPIRLGGTLSWGHDPHERVQARIDELATLDDTALIALLCGPDAVGPTPQYRPDARLRLRSAALDLRHDGAVGVATTSEVLGADGTPLGHGHTAIHRLPPNAWHGLTAPQVLAAAHAAHHDHLGLPPSEDAPLHLHPRGYPSRETRHPAAPPTTRRQGYRAAMRAVPRTITLHATYAGDLVIGLYAAIHDSEGRDLGHTQTYDHAVAPHEWVATSLAMLVDAAIAAHHDHLGLDAPTPATVRHLLHTGVAGHPGTTEAHPVAALTPEIVDHNALRGHLVTVKAAEMGVAEIPPHLHPALGDHVSDLPAGGNMRDARAAEIARRNAYSATHPPATTDRRPLWLPATI